MALKIMNQFLVLKILVGSQFVEHYYRNCKGFSSPYYLSGKYIKYERVGDTLYLEGNYTGKIFILYKGEILDDEGLPQITDEEAMAIAYFYSLCY